MYINYLKVIMINSPGLGKLRFDSLQKKLAQSIISSRSSRHSTYFPFTELGSFSFFWPITRALILGKKKTKISLSVRAFREFTYLSSFYFLSSHNNHTSIFLVDHVPEILYSIRKATLCSYVTFAKRIVTTIVSSRICFIDFFVL